MADPLLLAGLLAGNWRHLTFEPFRSGIEIHRLYTIPDGPAAALLRYAPGGMAPLHEHTGYEHVLVLDGSQSDDHGTYGTGALLVNPPGSRHSVRSEHGCVALLIWEKPIRFL
jgi:anti-sigma factor ChrR (cupin superfamily)